MRHACPPTAPRDADAAPYHDTQDRGGRQRVRSATILAGAVGGSPRPRTELWTVLSPGPRVKRQPIRLQIFFLLPVPFRLTPSLFLGESPDHGARFRHVDPSSPRPPRRHRAPPPLSLLFLRLVDPVPPRTHGCPPPRRLRTSRSVVSSYAFPPLVFNDRYGLDASGAIGFGL
jgi:hypothetical protein